MFAMSSWLIAARGETFGMSMVGIKVIRAIDGTTPSRRSSLVRSVIQLVAGPPLIFFGTLLLAISIWRNPLGQGWHDRKAGVLVVDPNRRELSQEVP